MSQQQYVAGFTPDVQGFTPDAKPVDPKLEAIKAAQAAKYPTQAESGKPVGPGLGWRALDAVMNTQQPEGTLNPYQPNAVENLLGAVGPSQATSIGEAIKGMMPSSILPDLAALKRAAVNPKVTIQEAAQALAERVGGSRNSTKLKSGEAVQGSLSTKIEDLKRAQKAAYDQVEELAAANPKAIEVAPSRTVERDIPDDFGGARRVKEVIPAVTETINAPVDVTSLKAALKPILAEIDAEIDVPQRALSAGYGTLKSIIEGPDVLPLTAAEGTLSRLKAIGRTETLPQIKGRSAGIAALGGKTLQGAIDSVASEIGATEHLNIGRALTKEKYLTGELLHNLSEEPVRLIDYLTSQGDKSIGRLREVAGSIPGELPSIGRAYINGILEKAASSGKFDSASAAKEWSKLGPESKKLLFGETAGQLDSLFSIVKEKINQPVSRAPEMIGATAGALIGEKFGGALAGATGAGIGATVGRSVANFVGNKLRLGDMTLTAKQAAQLMMDTNGAKLLKTALVMPVTDPSAAQLTKILLVTAAHANKDGQMKIPVPVP